jgi:cytochrome c553
MVGLVLLLCAWVIMLGSLATVAAIVGRGRPAAAPGRVGCVRCHGGRMRRGGGP